MTNVASPGSALRCAEPGRASCHGGLDAFFRRKERTLTPPCVFRATQRSEFQTGVNGDFQSDWARLTEIVEGRSEYRRGSLAVLKAKELAQEIVHRHHVGVTISKSKLAWLRNEERRETPGLGRYRQKEPEPEPEEDDDDAEF
jgi:hypothetical protein